METLTGTYETQEFDPIAFYLNSFGNPLWEEKPTSIILPNIEEIMFNLQFAAELIAWETTSDEALVAFETKLLEK